MIKIICVVLFSLLLLLCGCVTQRRCLDKFGGKEQTITVHDTVTVEIPVPVPADSLNGKIGIDTLNQLLSGRLDSLTDLSETKKLKISFRKDKLSNALRYSAKCMPDTIKVTKEVPVEVKADCPPSVVVDPDSVLRW